MRLLVATRRTQGHRSDDFAGGEPGELVMPHVRACSEPDDSDCACQRSLVGLRSAEPTTTVEVAELDMTLEDLCGAVRAALTDAGWLACVDDPEIADRWVGDVAWELIQAGARFPVGTVLERRGRALQAR